MEHGFDDDQGWGEQVRCWPGMRRAAAVTDTVREPPTTSAAHLLLRELPRPRRPGVSICDRPMQGHRGMELGDRKREAGTSDGGARSSCDLGRGRRSRCRDDLI
jgi:hypothetical protein